MTALPPVVDEQTWREELARLRIREKAATREQDAIAGLDVQRDELAVFVASAGADGDDLAFLRLLLRRIRDDDPAGGLGFGFDPANDHAVMKRAELGLCHVVFLDENGENCSSVRRCRTVVSTRHRGVLTWR